MRSRFLTIVLLLGLLSLAIVPAANADLPADMSWVKYGTAPVVASGLCGVTSPARPAVVKVDANTYYMYYTKSFKLEGAEIYLATSTDGTTWTCYTGTQPVLTKGGSAVWDEWSVAAPTVIKDGANSWKMWYTGRKDADRGSAAIGYATSGDGITWNKSGLNPVFSKGAAGAWDSAIVRDPAVVEISDTSYHMWYSGTNMWPYFQIGHATSTNGTTWLRDPANPVLSPGAAGSWDANEVYAPSVVYSGGKFDMFYSGNAGSMWLTGHARSDNGTGWTKDANAIISPEGGTAWDSGDSTDFVAALLDGSTWKVFYSGAGGSYQIGLATLEDEPQLTFRPLATSITVGGTTDVYIDLTAAKLLYGYQFEVHYDTKVTATEAWFDNGFFNTEGGYPAWNADHSTLGVVKFAVSKQKGTAADTLVNGSGVLAKISFHGDSAGLARLWFENDILANRDGVALTHSKTVGWLDVFGTATLSGVVNLQGRANRVDPGTVTVSDESGYYTPVTVNFSAADGTWTAIVPVFSGHCNIVAAHGLYLSNRITGVDVTVGGVYSGFSTTLKGGDADNSGLIDVSDLSCIGGAFGGTVGPFLCGTGSSDINADGTVNILDLVLAGGNYGLASPQTW